MEAKKIEDASKPYLEATETPNMDANEQANLQAVAIAQATIEATHIEATHKPHLEGK